MPVSQRLSKGGEGNAGASAAAERGSPCQELAVPRPWAVPAPGQTPGAGSGQTCGAEEDVRASRHPARARKEGT